MENNTSSMTGFGKAEVSSDNYTLCVELKTVNNRFKDFRFKMGSVFNEDEIKVRRELEKHFKRGSFEVSINYKRGEANQRFDDLDQNKISSFIDFIKSVAEKSGTELSIRPTDFLRSEFSNDDSESKRDELKNLLNQALPLAINSLKDSRYEEGRKLKEVMLNHRKEYELIFNSIEPHAEAFEKGVKEKLKKRFDENKELIKVEDSRFMQEVIYYLEKLDVHEELNRIKIHLQKLDSLLDKGVEIGRPLDFLLQELNRETNTIGSKSGVGEISEAVVKMKMQLEKMREQALNLE